MLTKDFTKKQIRDYVRSGGSYCPHCKSEDIQWISSNSEAGIIWQTITCETCDEAWHEIYHLVEVHALEPRGRRSTSERNRDDATHTRRI